MVAAVATVAGDRLGVSGAGEAGAAQTHAGRLRAARVQRCLTHGPRPGVRTLAREHPHTCEHPHTRLYSSQL